MFPLNFLVRTMTDPVEWQSVPINTRNIHRFLTENGYVKYRARTQNGMMILRYRDDNMPWCADIELDIEMNGQQTPPISVAGITPIRNNGAKLVIEQLYNWTELREFISQLHSDTRMGSYVSSPQDEISLAMNALSLRASHLESHVDSCLSAKFKRARDMPHFVRERESTGSARLPSSSQVVFRDRELSELMIARDRILARWDNTATVDKFAFLNSLFLARPSACITWRTNSDISMLPVTYTVQCSEIIRDFLRLDWKSDRNLLRNVVVYFKDKLQDVKEDVLDNDNSFTSVEHATHCVVEELENILDAMLMLNVIYKVYWRNLEVVEACWENVCYSLESTHSNFRSNMDCFFQFAAGHADYEQRMRNRRDVDGVVRELCRIPRGKRVAVWARDRLA